MRLAILLLASLSLAACVAHLPPVAAPSCAMPGSWVSPATGRPIADPVTRLAAHGVVLLGEHHDSAADHEWQLATIAALYARNPSLVLGFEMFPRAAQPALERWTNGGMTEQAFLTQTRWAQVWGMDPALYMPIFRFARDHHVPMLGLNVSGQLVHLVSKSGWIAVAPSDREGVGTPAPPTSGYRARLTEAMAFHAGPAMPPESLAHFIDAQLLWDRAMAEGIAAQHTREPARPVVAIMGAGHVEFGDGVPHQLAAIRVPDVATALQLDEPCAAIKRGIADAVHVPAGKPAS